MKTLLDTRSKKYWTQKAYDRWLAGRDPQDMPLHEAWTDDPSAAARLTRTQPPIAAGCEIVEVAGE